jgi:hypothetical protein
MEFVIANFHLLPAVRMTSRGKWVDPDAQRYLDNKAALSWEYKNIMNKNGWVILPPRQPLYIRWMVSRSGPLFKCDWDNLCKSLCDAAKGIVFPDDRAITLDLGGEKRQGEDLVQVAFGLVADLPIHTK